MRVSPTCLAAALSSTKTDWFSCLFTEAQSDLAAFVARRVGAQDAADVLQETWLKLHERIDSASWRERRAVLFTIAGHLAIDHWRRQQRHGQRFGEESAPEAVCPRPGPELRLAQRRQTEQLAEALAELPEDCRRAFLLNRLDGLTHREIAQQLGVCAKTVQRHIERALAHCVRRMAG